MSNVTNNCSNPDTSEGKDNAIWQASLVELHQQQRVNGMFRDNNDVADNHLQLPRMMNETRQSRATFVSPKKSPPPLLLSSSQMLSKRKIVGGGGGGNIQNVGNSATYHLNTNTSNTITNALVFDRTNNCDITVEEETAIPSTTSMSDKHNINSSSNSSTTNSTAASFATTRTTPTSIRATKNSALVWSKPNKKSMNRSNCIANKIVTRTNSNSSFGSTSTNNSNKSGTKTPFATPPSLLSMGVKDRVDTSSGNNNTNRINGGSGSLDKSNKCITVETSSFVTGLVQEQPSSLPLMTMNDQENLNQQQHESISTTVSLKKPHQQQKLSLTSPTIQSSLLLEDEKDQHHCDIVPTGTSIQLEPPRASVTASMISSVSPYSSNKKQLSSSTISPSIIISSAQDMIASSIKSTFFSSITTTTNEKKDTNSCSNTAETIVPHKESINVNKNNDASFSSTSSVSVDEMTAIQAANNFVDMMTNSAKEIETNKDQEKQINQNAPLGMENSFGESNFDEHGDMADSEDDNNNDDDDDIDEDENDQHLQRNEYFEEETPRTSNKERISLISIAPLRLDDSTSSKYDLPSKQPSKALLETQNENKNSVGFVNPHTLDNSATDTRVNQFAYFEGIREVKRSSSSDELIETRSTDSESTVDFNNDFLLRNSTISVPSVFTSTQSMDSAIDDDEIYNDPEPKSNDRTILMENKQEKSMFVLNSGEDEIDPRVTSSDTTPTSSSNTDSSFVAIDAAKDRGQRKTRSEETLTAEPTVGDAPALGTARSESCELPSLYEKAKVLPRAISSPVAHLRPLRSSLILRNSAGGSGGGNSKSVSFHEDTVLDNGSNERRSSSSQKPYGKRRSSRRSASQSSISKSTLKSSKVIVSTSTSAGTVLLDKPPGRPQRLGSITGATRDDSMGLLQKASSMPTLIKKFEEYGDDPSSNNDGDDSMYMYVRHHAVSSIVQDRPPGRPVRLGSITGATPDGSMILLQKASSMPSLIKNQNININSNDEQTTVENDGSFDVKLKMGFALDKTPSRPVRVSSITGSSDTSDDMNNIDRNSLLQKSKSMSTLQRSNNDKQHDPMMMDSTSFQNDGYVGSAGIINRSTTNTTSIDHHDIDDGDDESSSMYSYVKQQNVAIVQDRPPSRPSRLRSITGASSDDSLKNVRYVQQPTTTTTTTTTTTNITNNEQNESIQTNHVPAPNNYYSAPDQYRRNELITEWHYPATECNTIKGKVETLRVQHNKDRQKRLHAKNELLQKIVSVEAKIIITENDNDTTPPTTTSTTTQEDLVKTLLSDLPTATVFNNTNTNTNTDNDNIIQTPQQNEETTRMAAVEPISDVIVDTNIISNSSTVSSTTQIGKFQEQTSSTTQPNIVSATSNDVPDVASSSVTSIIAYDVKNKQKQVFLGTSLINRPWIYNSYAQNYSNSIEDLTMLINNNDPLAEITDEVIDQFKNEEEEEQEHYNSSNNENTNSNVVPNEDDEVIQNNHEIRTIQDVVRKEVQESDTLYNEPLNVTESVQHNSFNSNDTTNENETFLHDKPDNVRQGDNKMDREATPPTMTTTTPSTTQQQNLLYRSNNDDEDKNHDDDNEQVGIPLPQHKQQQQEQADNDHLTTTMEHDDDDDGSAVVENITDTVEEAQEEEEENEHPTKHTTTFVEKVYNNDSSSDDDDADYWIKKNTQNSIIDDLSIDKVLDSTDNNIMEIVDGSTATKPTESFVEEFDETFDGELPPAFLRNVPVVEHINHINSNNHTNRNDTIAGNVLSKLFFTATTKQHQLSQQQHSAEMKTHIDDDDNHDVDSSSSDSSMYTSDDDHDDDAEARRRKEQRKNKRQVKKIMLLSSNEKYSYNQVALDDRAATTTTMNHVHTNNNISSSKNGSTTGGGGGGGIVRGWMSLGKTKKSSSASKMNTNADGTTSILNNPKEYGGIGNNSSTTSNALSALLSPIKIKKANGSGGGVGRNKMMMMMPKINNHNNNNNNSDSGLVNE